MTNLTDAPKMPSNNTFGCFFSAVFAMIALYSYYQHHKTFAYATTFLFFLFAAITLYAPQVLTPLNRLWFQLGMLLGRAISPIVLGVMFFLILTPIAIITRLFGRDELNIRKSLVQSYWVERIPSGPQSDSFKNQF